MKTSVDLFGNIVTSPDEPEIISSATAIPVVITMTQAKIALHRAGLLPTVEGLLAALPEPTRTEAQIAWTSSSSLTRYDPFVQQLLPLLQLTPQAIDQLFITAASL